MRIAVLGAGSIGSFVGGIWATHGIDITLVGRPSTIETLRNGLRLTDYNGFDQSLPAEHVNPTIDPRELANADLILLSVKSNDTDSAADEIAAFATPGTPILSLQNGVSNAVLLAAQLPEFTVLPGMVSFNVAIRNDVWHKGSVGKISAQYHPVLEALAAQIADGPAPLELVNEMRPIAWGKLLLNLNNAVNALSGLSLRDELSNRAFRQVLAASMDEALAVLKAAHIRPAKVGAMAPERIPNFLRLPNFIFRPIGLRLQKIDAMARSSMADDLARGRITEIDFLNGEIVTLAGNIRRKAPVNAKLTQLVKAAEAGDTRRWSGPELLAEIKK